ncbi:MAG: ABC transporter ATP-binding protein [Bacteroidetes bacterium]|jgi:ABC-2 type transport system ATP-binding protein|nr:ABC transporter ATP-binding protein [Bacteroidota bacterium]
MDIVVENLVKTYGPQRAVDNISFTVRTGEVLGFLGPNGAGKTTTMKAITTFLVPDSGNIKVGKYSIYDEPEQLKKNIGYLPENNPLYEDMPVIDYLKFVGKLQGIADRELTDSLINVIDLCGLEGEKHKKIGELSKGYKQRVGLAQALIHKPEVLILDEPTTGLDPNQIVEIRELIRKIGKEKTVILSSHILAEVEATCDRIMIINKGKIVADGTTRELRSQASGSATLKVKIEGGALDEVFSALKEIPGVAVVDFLDKQNFRFVLEGDPEAKLANAVFAACVKKGWVITELIPVETKLEDIFKELTTDSSVKN